MGVLSFTANMKIGIRAEFIEVAAAQSENTIFADIERVDNFGNYRLVSARVNGLGIKVKVKRETPLPDGKLGLRLPSDKLCVYEDERLI
jgi:glycerol transport system ATP-binding protein